MLEENKRNKLSVAKIPSAKEKFDQPSVTPARDAWESLDAVTIVALVLQVPWVPSWSELAKRSSLPAAASHLSGRLLAARPPAAHWCPGGSDGGESLKRTVSQRHQGDLC